VKVLIIEDNPIDLNLPGSDGLTLVRELVSQVQTVAGSGPP
jgi:CheY-like chemotaxis protein